MFTASARARLNQDAQAPQQRPPATGEAPSPAPYLGPGVVLEGSGDRFLVQLADAEGNQVQAQLALAFPYRPAIGDSLLVLGQAGRHYVVGLLHGSGQVDLTFQGDVSLRALGGTLKLAGDSGLKLESPEVTVRARTIRPFAESLSEKVSEAYRWVKGTLTVRAGESRRVVEGEDLAQSKRSTTLAKDVVRIDGGQTQLGH